jgi:hypothetical protein
MNPFTIHPRQHGMTYGEHCYFAMSIACRLLISVVAFAVHAILPFAPIERRLDLESTAAYLAERNRWIKTVKARSTPARNRILLPLPSGAGLHPLNGFSLFNSLASLESDTEIEPGERPFRVKVGRDCHVRSSSARPRATDLRETWPQCTLVPNS